jgi:hypothetical protein
MGTLLRLDSRVVGRGRRASWGRVHRGRMRGALVLLVATISCVLGADRRTVHRLDVEMVGLMVVVVVVVVDRREAMEAEGTVDAEKVVVVVL